MLVGMRDTAVIPPVVDALPGGANGKGPSFAYAWQHNLPWREDKSSPGHEGQAWVLAVARYRAVPGEATDNDARQGQDDPLWKTGNRSI